MKAQLSGFPSKDKPWEKYYTDSDRNIVLPECTIFQNIYDGNKDFLKDIALNYYGNKISYGRLFHFEKNRINKSGERFCV